MFPSIAQLITLPAAAIYALLFPIAIIEGPIITVVAGFLAADQVVNFFLVYLIVVAGDVTGDCFYYCIGRFGGKKFFDRWGRYFGITTERIASMEKHFSKHSGKTILISKITHGIGPAILIAAGASHVTFKKFFIFSALGALPMSLIFLSIGYFFGQAYLSIGKYLDWFGLAASGLAILIFFGYRLLIRFAKKYEEKI